MEDEKILIRNASQVVTCSGFEAKRGKAMSDVGVIEDGAVAVSNGIITHVGPTEVVLRQVDVEDYLEIDACGRALLPGFSAVAGKRSSPGGCGETAICRSWSGEAVSSIR